MLKLEPIIRNKFGEKLDTWVESGEGEIKANVIMVHGFGTSKHETAGYFDDISSVLVNDNFRVIRFDFSGYGNSDGKQEEVCYSKQVLDLQTIHNYVNYTFSEPIYMFSQSMGTWVTALYSPYNIIKTIFTGIPNSNTQVVIDRVTERFGTRAGAKLNMEGVSLLPRSTGKVQKIGSYFWDDIRKLDPINVVKNYSEKTNLLLVHWENDEIIGKDYLAEYDSIPTLKSMWLPGDHSLTNPRDRQNFIKILLNYYNN